MIELYIYIYIHRVNLFIIFLCPNIHSYSLRYKDIGELMRRCETLVATREDLTKMRDRIKATISEEEESLAQFKEEQNERILELRLVS